MGTFESNRYRARRADVQVDDPLDGSVELAGLWVVVPTPKAVPEVADLVAREFDVDASRSLSIEDAAAQNARLTHAVSADGLRYAYPTHVVTLDDRREGLPEWSRFADLRVRIDVATLLQYASERFDDTLPFYWPKSYPAEARDVLRGVTRLLVDPRVPDEVSEEGGSQPTAWYMATAYRTSDWHLGADRYPPEWRRQY